MAKGQKKDGSARKITKGIPRVTANVLAGGEALAKYNEAVSKLSAELQKECAERLAAAQKDGPKARKVDFATIFNGRSVEDLTTAKGALDAALKVAAEQEESKMANLIAKMEAQLKALRSVKSEKVSVTAPVEA